MAFKIRYIHAFNLMHEFIRNLDRNLINAFRYRIEEIDHQLNQFRETTRQLTEAAKLQAEAMPGLIEDIVEKKLTNDPHAVLVAGFCRAIDLAIKAGAKQKGRRVLVVRLSNALEARRKQLSKPIRHHQHTGTKMFPADVCDW